MDQHTVPSFYLEGFTDPETPDGQEPACWILSPPRPDWYRRAPVNLTKIPDYYDSVNPDGSPDRSLEERLGKLEAAVAPVIAALREGSALSAGGRKLIALFAATMRGRTVAIPEDLERAHKAVEELVRRQREERGEPPGGGLGLFPAKRGFIQSASVAGSVEASLGIFLAMGWSLAVAEPPYYFITSDNPVSVCDPSAPPRDMHNLLSPTVEVVFPLRRDIALFASRLPFGTWWRKASSEAVRRVNLRTRQYISHHAIAPKPDLPGTRLDSDGNPID